MFVLAFEILVVVISCVNCWNYTDFELFTYREERFTYIHIMVFGALLLSKPYVVKILDKIVNKKVDIVTNCLKKCAQRSLINSFEKNQMKMNGSIERILLKQVLKY